MKTDDTYGIAPDEREGTTLRTSATSGPMRTLEEATRAALISLVRLADGKHVELDAGTVTTEVKRMRATGQVPAAFAGHLVIATGIGYPARVGADTDLFIDD